MSLSLQKTKRRISSVSSTRKITKAMELVSTSKLKRWRNVFEVNKFYSQSLNKIVKNITPFVGENLDSPFFKQGQGDHDLYIVCTSTLGLCAGYNYNVFALTDKIVKENDEIIVIGEKGYSHFKNNYPKLNSSYVSINEKIEYEQICNLGKNCISSFLDNKYRNIYLIYTEFLNAISFKPKLVTLLPFAIDNSEEEKDDKEFVIMEPSPKSIIEELVPLNIYSSLYSKILESEVSEQGARRNAMENATKNADDITEKLMLEYNKARQSSITQEITEIVAGSSAD